MKISVKLKPNAKEEKVIQVSQREFLVWVKARPERGKANLAAREVLARHFAVAKSCIRLLKGQACRQKLFEVSQ